jgi:FAD-dependent oxidoreductase family protein
VSPKYSSRPAIRHTKQAHSGGETDVKGADISLDYVGGNTNYPDASYRERDRIYQDHIDYEKGFLWFLAHDSRIPQELRNEVNSWGLCRDEWADTNYWPVQLYIREGRRLKGELVMTENDVLRDQTKADSVGLGSFVLDSHWVRRFCPRRGPFR